jgi:hypothetical protein
VHLPQKLYGASSTVAPVPKLHTLQTYRVTGSKAPCNCNRSYRWRQAVILMRQPLCTWGRGSRCLLNRGLGGSKSCSGLWRREVQHFYVESYGFLSHLWEWRTLLHHSKQVWSNGNISNLNVGVAESELCHGHQLSWQVFLGPYR